MGTRTAGFTGMGFITMWTHGDHRCVFVVGGEQMLLRLVDATSILREQVVGADAAAVLATLWETEDASAASTESQLPAFA
jgi:hypothetical protein